MDNPESFLGANSRSSPRKQHNSFSRRSFLRGIGAAAFAGTLSACGGSASSGQRDSYRLIAAHATSESHFMHRAFMHFKEQAELLSEGRIQVKVISNGIFGGDRALTESVALDSIQLAAPSTAPLSSFSPNMGVWDIAYLFKDKPTAYRVFDGPLGQRLLDELSVKRIKGLGYWESGFRNLTSNKASVQSVTDLRGVKIRTLETPAQLRAWGGTGAAPTPMAFPEVYTGLQQGTIDAQENPITLIYSQRFYEVQKTLTLSEHIYSVKPLILSQKFYDSLPSDLQEVVEIAGKSSVDFSRKESAKDELEALEQMKTEGLHVEELSPEGRSELREAMQKATIPYVRSTLGDEIVDSVMKEVQG